MKNFVFGVAVAVLFFSASSGRVEARFFGAGLDGESLVEPAACTVSRERIVRPNGAVVRRTVRQCVRGDRRKVRARRTGGRCVVIREQVARPSGAVVFRVKRRCG